MIQCVIFDCDGTLVDSEYLTHLAMAQLLGERGIRISADEMSERYRGAKLSRVIEVIESMHSIEIDDAYISTYRDRVEELFEAQLQACDGVHEALSQIELPVCVASNAPQRKIRSALKFTGLAHFFGEHIFSAYEVDAWKPAPDLFLHAAEAMGCKPGQCAVVEDSIVGVEAALAANTYAIGYNPVGRLPHVEGLRMIEHMRELPEIVNGSSPPQ